jgi:hypothetical protein
MNKKVAGPAAQRLSEGILKYSYVRLLLCSIVLLLNLVQAQLLYNFTDLLLTKVTELVTPQPVQEVKNSLETLQDTYNTAVNLFTQIRVPEYNYKNDLNLLVDLLKDNEDAFVFLAGHYQAQSQKLNELKGDLPTFDPHSFTVQQDSLTNCMSRSESLDMLDKNIKELEESTTKLTEVKQKLDEYSVNLELAKTILEKFKIFFEELLDFPDPLRVVSNKAVLYWFDIETVVDDEISNLRDTLDSIREKVSELLSQIQATLQGLRDSRLTTNQNQCLLIGLWEGTCTFSGDILTTNVSLDFRVNIDNQIGSLTLQGGDEVTVEENGELVVYTVPQITYQIANTKIVWLIQPSIVFDIQSSDVGLPTGQFVGSFTQDFFNLKGKAGDSVDPNFLTCSVNFKK